MKHRSFYVAFACAISLLAVGCGNKNVAMVQRDRPVVVTTTAMIADAVKSMVGEQAEVIYLMGEGVDPHSYNPTRDDVIKLLSADLVFYNGLLLEGKMDGAFNRVRERGIPVHAVTGLIREDLLLDDEDEPGEADPHIWMDVNLWAQAVSHIREVLLQEFPGMADGIHAGANAYTEQLKNLDDYVRSIVKTVPVKKRVLVTAHDAFQYFGRAYDIDVRGIQGISTESEAGVHDINELVDFLVTRGVGAVFVESSVSDKNVKAVIEGAAARRHNVVIGAELFSDAMGPSGTYEGTYVGMIDHNATRFVQALGGEAPERGKQGRLAEAR